MKLFQFLPAPFWCYMAPMVLSTFGLLPAQSPFYTFWSSYGLAACLLLLLLGSQPVAVARLSGPALATMAAGSIGIGLGAFTATLLWQRWLPAEAWKALGTLSASWTGGSANMVAVKEALSTPDALMPPLIIVDSLGTYLWMALLIALAPWQSRWDQRTRGRSCLTALPEKAVRQERPLDVKASLPIKGALVGAAFLLGWACLQAGTWVPWTNPIFTHRTWGILIVTTTGLALAMSPAAQFQRFGTTQLGTWLLYVLLMTLGAKAKLTDIFEAPVFLACGLTFLGVHAAVILAYGWWRRVPLALLATASQANIGGVASTPIVAGLYDSRLTSLGLLLALTGNLLGTYIGIVIALGCRFLLQVLTIN